MKYIVSEDDRGRVTVSEIDSVTRRVVRSCVVGRARGEWLLTRLAQSVPAAGKVRRRRRADPSDSWSGELFADDADPLRVEVAQGILPGRQPGGVSRPVVLDTPARLLQQAFVAGVVRQAADGRHDSRQVFKVLL